MWNLGFASGLSLMIQVSTGVVVSMNYNPGNPYNDLDVVERDRGGWFWRGIHSAGASTYFVIMYLHTLRSLVINSTNFVAWSTGLLVLLWSLLTALLGYALTYGNMAHWALTVVSSVTLVLPYGDYIQPNVVGGFSVNMSMVPRVYSTHYLTGLCLLAVVSVHVHFVHEEGNNSELGVNSNLCSIDFLSAQLVKDSLTAWGVITLLCILQVKYHKLDVITFDPQVFRPVNTEAAPEPIGPEWYVLPPFGGLKITEVPKLILMSVFVCMASTTYIRSRTPMILMIGVLLMILGIQAMTAHVNINMAEAVGLSVSIIALSVFIE